MSLCPIPSKVAKKVSLETHKPNRDNAHRPDMAPEVYTTPPSPPTPGKSGQLTEIQVKQYFEKGYVLVPDFFTKDELQPVIEAIQAKVDKIANKLYDAGKINNKHDNAGFYQRLILLEKEFKGTAVLLHKEGSLPPAFQNLWTNERLLNVIEQLIGPDIAGHPVWNLRTKTPFNEQTTVPWHQDNAYLDHTSLHTLQPTAWIPLVDATEETGCMQVASGGHLKGVTATHTCCVGNTWYVQVSEEEMTNTLGVDLEKDIVTCEVPMGGVLFLNNCIPHRSLENRSDKVRWSVDLRWQDPSKPNGFYGIKECVPMRKANDPTYQVDWETWAATDRYGIDVNSDKLVEDEFDTTIHGPWMKRWEIVNHNRHVLSLEKDKNLKFITKA